MEALHTRSGMKTLLESLDGQKQRQPETEKAVHYALQESASY